MEDSNKKQFSILMTGCAETYDKAVSKAKLLMYWEALKPYSMEQVSMAFTKHLSCPKHGTFFPKPADLLRQINGDQPDLKDVAQLAWMSVIHHIQKVGAYGNLDIEDKVAIAAVRQMGGWQSLCMTDMDKMPFRERQFMEYYQNLSTAPLDALPNHLAGIIETHNNKIANKGGFQNPVLQEASRRYLASKKGNNQ